MRRKKVNMKGHWEHGGPLPWTMELHKDDRLLLVSED